MCSWFQNVEETEIWVCVLFVYLLNENCCAMATSEQNVFRPQEKSEMYVPSDHNVRRLQILFMVQL